MLGKLLEGYTAQDILVSTDSCVMRLGHFPTPRDIYTYLPKKDELQAWSERGLPEYRTAIFSFSDFCRSTYQRMDAHAQGQLDEVILLSKQKNVPPKDALSAVFKICLKPELLTDVSSLDRAKHAHGHGEHAGDAA